MKFIKVLVLLESIRYLNTELQINISNFEMPTFMLLNMSFVFVCLEPQAVNHLNHNERACSLVCDMAFASVEKSSSCQSPRHCNASSRAINGYSSVNMSRSDM